MLLKGALHVRTTCSDGEMTPQEAADAYEERGFDFIAFTDHDYLLKPDYREVYSRVKSRMEFSPSSSVYCLCPHPV